jgi:hypothetical protein
MGLDMRKPETYLEWRRRLDADALEADLAARRGERSIPRRPLNLSPMDPSDVIDGTRYTDGNWG